MTVKYASIFYSKALQNLSKLGFLVWKQTIWQPCEVAEFFIFLCKLKQGCVQCKDVGRIFDKPIYQIIYQFTKNQCIDKPIGTSTTTFT
jgi:hypothetical protein